VFVANAISVDSVKTEWQLLEILLIGQQKLNKN
jgi:hypothetical protein